MDSSTRAAVLAEVQLVMSAMARNAHWSREPDFSSDPSEPALLWHSLSGLRSRLSIELIVTQPLDPFLAVLRSPQASGIVTGVAITAVSRMLTLGVLSCDQQDCHETVEQLLRAISECKFESIDPDSDQAVLIRLLQLISAIPGANLYLTTSQVERLVEAALHITTSNLAGLSQLSMSRTAAQQLVQNTILQLCDHSALSESHPALLRLLCHKASRTKVVAAADRQGNGGSAAESDSVSRLQLLSTWLLVQSIERLGPTVCLQQPMLSVIRQELCQSLMAVGRYCGMSLHTLAIVVRGITWIVEHAAHELHQQVSQLLTQVPLRLLESKSTPPEVRQLAFECLGALCHIPRFLPELYVNFDCCEYSPECLLERTLQALHKGIYPVAGRIEATHSAALHATVAALQSSLERLKAAKPGSVTIQAELTERRRHKQEQVAAASVFNASPRKGLEQLASLLPLDDIKAANFLKNNKFVQKKALGEFFGSRSKIQIRADAEAGCDFSILTLRAFIGKFDWKNKSFDVALRELLHAFRLPGEAQMIDRIMEAFAGHYLTCNPTAFDTADTGYTLAFSLMMLNTDLHNPSIKNKMTCEGFIKNNRGIGANQSDVDEVYLRELFDSIKRNEIRMVSEQLPEDLDEFEWHQLVETEHQYCRMDDTWGAQVESLLFGASWSGTLAALSVVLEAQESSKRNLDVAAMGLKMCAQLAVKLELPRVLENIISTFAHSLHPLSSQSMNEAQLNATLASNNSMRVAVLGLFEATHEYGNLLTRSSWSLLVEQALMLNRYGLVVPHSTLCEPQRGEQPFATPTADQPADLTPASSASWGDLFADSDQDEAANQMQKAAADLIFQSSLVRLFADDSKFLPVDSLQLLVDALHAGCVPPGSTSASAAASCSLCLHWLVEVALHNRDRFEILWPQLKASIEQLLAQTASIKVRQRATAATMRLCARLAHKTEISSILFRTVETWFISSTDEPFLDGVRSQLAHGVFLIVQNNVLHLARCQGSWDTTIALIAKVAIEEHAPVALAALEHAILHSRPFTEETLKPCLAALEQLLLCQSAGKAAQSSALQLLLTIQHQLCHQQAAHDTSVWPLLGRDVLTLLSNTCCSKGISDSVCVDALGGFLQLLSLGSQHPLNVSQSEWLWVLQSGLFPTLHQLQAIQPPSAECRIAAGIATFQSAMATALPLVVRSNRFDSLWRSSLVLLGGFTRLGNPLLKEVRHVLEQMLSTTAQLLDSPSNFRQSELWSDTLEVAIASFAAEVCLSEQVMDQMIGQELDFAPVVSKLVGPGAPEAANLSELAIQEDPAAVAKIDEMYSTIVVNGPSGVGKGTLINKLMAEFPQLFGFSVSHTTRGARDGEEDGVHYHFSTHEKMEAMITNGDFIESAHVHGNIYGTSKGSVQNVVDAGKICVLDIDVQGAQSVKKAGLTGVGYVFVKPPSMQELEDRLRGRATETEDKILKRLANAKGELDFAETPGFYDKVVVNNELEVCYKEICGWIDVVPIIATNVLVADF